MRPRKSRIDGFRRVRCGGLFAAAILGGCAGVARPLPTYNAVPEFTLTDSTGAEFGSRALEGKIWIADFVFTNCSGPCPRMSSLMRQLQAALVPIPETKLISFTVDPERDTPEALAAYARRYQAQADRWYFLTGPRETLHRLKREAFLLGDVRGNLDHSTRLVLVDRRGRVRGYYSTEESSDLGRLLADVRRLARERS